MSAILVTEVPYWVAILALTPLVYAALATGSRAIFGDNSTDSID